MSTPQEKLLPHFSYVSPVGCVITKCNAPYSGLYPKTMIG
ncbi:hypothetical protein FDUTEX481_03827 [Tolypothrix sp. PCC 7601]|nr:hypothetical protein FDUTEX481_03827 [Tolypothrix sp. PCC 7601]